MNFKKGDKVESTYFHTPGKTGTVTFYDGNSLCHVKWDDGEKYWSPVKFLKKLE